MSSNAYIATDEETVMKVGKANDIKRREKQIAVRITRTVACLDEEAALRVESKLREFVMKRGGIRYHSTIDWFHFDQQIYSMLCEFVAGLNNEPAAEVDVDTEIAEYIMRYHQLLVEEVINEKNDILRPKAELQGEMEHIQRENAYLKQMRDEMQNKILDLIEEKAYWKTSYKLQVEISEAEKSQRG